MFVVFVCVFGFHWEFFSHMMSPLPVKGLKSLPLLGTYSHWAVPHLLWHGTSVYNDPPRGIETNTCCWVFSSGATCITTCFYDLGLSRLGFEHETFRLWGECSSQLRHRCSYELMSWKYIRMLLILLKPHILKVPT